MNWGETFAIALAGLSANRMRAMLTVLGVVIGVTAVISMISIGRGLGTYINNQFSELGATRLTVATGNGDFSLSATPKRVKPLTDENLRSLSNPQIAPHVRAVSAEFAISGEIKGDQPRAISINISGVTPTYSEVMNWRPQRSSRFITDEDNQAAARVAVLGTTLVRRLFGSEQANPLGLTVKINDRDFTVVGVMAKRTALGFDPNNAVFIPINTAQTRLGNAREPGGLLRISGIQVLATSQATVNLAEQEMRTYLRRVREPDANGSDSFTISNEAQQLNSLTQITGTLTIFLAAIGGISLLVGGIGIMNIMMVSVTERTREIGLRKAVGARGVDILGQFLIESVLMSLVGGGIGILLSVAIVLIANVIAPQFQVTLATEAVIVAVTVSSAVGVSFGLYPASRAANLSPIQALRFE